MCPPAQMQMEMPRKKVRCVLVHDYVLWRQGLRRLLEDEPDLEVVSEAGDAAECLRKVFECRPDVVIVDAGAFGLSAAEAERLVARQWPYTKVVFLSEQELCGSGFDGSQTFTEYSAARQTSVEQLVKMVRSVCGRLHPAEQRPPASEPAAAPADTLTSREIEVLKLLAEGKTVRRAATDLGLSSKTVDAHKFNLMRKLGIHNKAELVMWAIQKRVVKVPA